MDGPAGPSQEGLTLGPFRLLSPIARGAMGEVWRGAVGDQGPAVAIKVLARPQGGDAWATEAFRNEVRAVAGLDHPHIVTILDQGRVDEQTAARSSGRLLPHCPFLVMPYIEGRPLQAFVGRLSWDDQRTILLQLAEALAHSHARGLIHRDLKPGNVILATRPDEEPHRPLHAWITDFGLADSLDREAPTDQTVAGTPAYMAPEQLVGAWRDQGPWTDLYALGCLGWALATGQPPFGRGRSFAELKVDHHQRPPPAFWPRMPVPEGLIRWLCRTLQKRPTDRFRCAADAAEALRALPRVADEIPLLPRFPAAPTEETLPPRALDLSTHITSDGGVAPPISVNLTWPAEPVPALPSPPPATIDEEAPSAATLPGVGLSLFGLRAIPLVGRQAERQQLWDALRAVHADHCTRAVILQGAAGVGKARLAEWLAEHAQETGAAIALHARFAPTDAPGAALGALLAQHSRSQGLPRAERLARLADLGLGELGEGGAELLAELIRPATPAEIAAGARPIRFGAARERIVVLERALWRIAREGRPHGQERPLLLWLEDPGATPEGAELATYLLSESALPLLLIITDTPPDRGGDRLTELRRDPRALTLAVDPLGPAEHRALVRQLAGLEGELIEQMVERTQGSPLFAVQLITDWVARGALEPGPQGYRLAPGATLELPASLQELWGSRVDQALAALPLDEQGAIELAALLGPRVNPEEWAAAAELAGHHPSRATVNHLLALRLAYIEDDGPDWSFAHPMVRAALERRAAARGLLRSNHRAIARSLRERSAGTPGVVERIGRHLLGAGQHHAALGWLLDGAAERLASGDLHGTQRLLDLREEALAAAHLDPTDLQWGEGWLLRAAALRQARDLPAARAQAERALAQALAQKARRPAIRALTDTGRVLHSLGLIPRAWRRLREAERLALALGDASHAARASTELARILMERGRFSPAHDRLLAAQAAFRARAELRGEAQCAWLLGALAKQQGDLVGAAAHLARALAGYETVGARDGVARCTNELGEVARLSGDLDLAEQRYREALTRMEELGGGDMAVMRFNLGLVLQERGQVDAAEGPIRDALSRFTRSGHTALAGACHIALLTGAAAHRDWAAWDHHARQGAHMVAQATFTDCDVAASAERAGRLALQASEGPRAAAALHLALTQWSALGRQAEAQRVAALLRP